MKVAVIALVLSLSFAPAARCDVDAGSLEPGAYPRVGPARSLDPSVTTTGHLEVLAGTRRFSEEDARVLDRQRALFDSLAAWYPDGRPHTLAELRRRTGLFAWAPTKGDLATPGRAVQLLAPTYFPQPDGITMRRSGELLILKLHALDSRGELDAHLALTRVALAYLRDVELGMGSGPSLSSVLHRGIQERMLFRHLRRFVPARARTPAEVQRYLDAIEQYERDAQEGLAAMTEVVRRQTDLVAVQKMVCADAPALEQARRFLNISILEGGRLKSWCAQDLLEEASFVFHALTSERDVYPELGVAAKQIELLIPLTARSGESELTRLIPRLDAATWLRRGTGIVLRVHQYRLRHGRYPSDLAALEEAGTPPVRRQPDGRPFAYWLLGGERFEMPAPKNGTPVSERLWPMD